MLTDEMKKARLATMIAHAALVPRMDDDSRELLLTLWDCILHERELAMR
jgi:hypothetical protein